MGFRRIVCVISRVLFVSGCVLLLSGCASPYAKARVADLQDTFGFALGGGVGLSVDAKLGGLTQPSLGVGSTALLVGSLGRDVDGLIFERRISFPYTTRLYLADAAGIGDILNTTGWHIRVEAPSSDQAFEMMTDSLQGEVPTKLRFERSAEEKLGRIVDEGRFLPIPGRASAHPPSLTRFELGGHALIFSARAAFDPLELADFLVGLGGLDIRGDDERIEVGDDPH